MSLMDVVTFTLFNAVACMVLPKLISIVFPIHKNRRESKPKPPNPILQGKQYKRWLFLLQQ
ncbi:hypothetical protein CEP10_07270 [Cylindrospermopsis raciborskii S07]|uniref:Uncharacterized protein n=2 Tax=Cylindrospermopsis raciborskii TaxID=77022 RepID=A0A853M946_9CYAN|nr:hypothetical protein CRC_00127 [Cylindrospermopsis raciborskii CS-505]OHY39845.1 hypothetical protein BCV63_11915 [Cylindrospermopsis raciborskii CS-508]PNJ97862.1 hypothetical protein CEP13_01865 [Cylindrospermopsis raciborskii C03]PNJ99439.1 hypothetical protein CEP14_00755 [Cylindrospermopsis raciborskii C04]PNK00407.1 hypothetical protein CEP15_03770 [Cylindrospermopsis raciborskii C07]PNK01297.1 hypothetical protein CEP11_17770 [Cylindrospermopsis raciborskii S10]PNK08351.1 hypothetic